MDTKALRQKILDLAIRGKLVPQDPNDEPASVLLERIREEKKQMVKEGKLKPKDIKNDTIIFKGEDNLHYEKFQDGTVKCIEEEIPFEVPDGWEWCRLQDLFIVCSAKRVLQADWKEEGIPFYRAREIVKLSDDGFVDNELFISEAHYLNLKKNYGVPNTGDIMLSAVGTIGKPYIVQENDTFYYKDASVICLQKIGYDVSSEYIRLVLEAPYMQKMMYANSNGTTVDTITISTANQYYIAVPPLSEQLRIVDLAKILLGHNLEIEEQKEKLIELIAVTKNKILDLAIRGKLVPHNSDDEPASVLLERIRNEKESLVKQGKLKRNKKESIIYKGDDNSYYEQIGSEIRNISDEIPFDIPEAWEWCRLGVIGNWQSGATPSRKHPEYYDGNIPWLKTGDLNDDFITNIPEYITEEGMRNSSAVLNPIGSVLIAMYGATIGKLGILTIEATTNQACCACLPILINNEYLFYYLMQHKAEFISSAVGGAQPNISKEKIVSTLFPVPPLAEQLRIVEEIKKLFNLISSIDFCLSS